LISQGDIFWVDFDIPDGSGPGYRRPCVVIQNNLFNMSKINTVMVCIITSNLNLTMAPGNVLLKKSEGGLPKDSVVNVSQVMTLDKSGLGEKIGALGKARVKEILAGIELFIRPREIS
jgi:mRNA interferase MazF